MVILSSKSIKHANDDIGNSQLLLTLFTYSVGKWINFVYLQHWQRFQATFPKLTGNLHDFMVIIAKLTQSMEVGAIFTTNGGNFKEYCQRWWRTYPTSWQTQKN